MRFEHDESIADVDNTDAVGGWLRLVVERSTRNREIGVEPSFPNLRFDPYYSPTAKRANLMLKARYDNKIAVTGGSLCGFS